MNRRPPSPQHFHPPQHPTTTYHDRTTAASISIDISDILASAVPPAPHPAPSSSRAHDLQALTQAWITERTGPELQAYPHALMERTLGRLRQQISAIEREHDRAAERSVMERGRGRGFQLIIQQTEVERQKFVVRSLLRARLAKIDRFPVHYGGGAGALLLSAAEEVYRVRHQELLERMYRAAFLGRFPSRLGSMRDGRGAVSMVEGPDARAAVWVRVVREGGVVVVGEGDGDGGDGGDGDGEGGGGGGKEGQAQALKRGDVCVLRYSAVRDAVRRGDVLLI
ncbi:MAG: GINS complex subunit [Phylliscum demangeonii]|nr:MAG: GINS complex subunit [Phylliscum demangeonii]